jgi:endoglucanase
LTLQIEGTPSDINEFYRKAIFAIREVDKKTPIILEATGTGDFSSIAILKPSQDPYVFYSFHYYEPYAYYKGKAAQGRLVYPGPIIIDGPLWNKQAHRTNFAKVDNWRKSNQIDCSHLYVGEFGVWKDAIGAQTYLRDITDLFEEFGWSWTYYAFREDAFPHVDLELEGELKQRTETPLFKIVRSKFQ